jgi:signal transduction histidine kinase
MKRCFELLLLLCSSVIAIAQNNLPPVFEITSDTAIIDTLPRAYWQMLEDKDGNLSFAQVQQFPFANQFHYNPTGKINRKVSTNWFRFIIKNATGHDVNIGFYDHYLGASDWYLITADTTIHKKTGFETPWSKKDDLKLINFISTAIKAGEVLTVYERANYDYFNFSTSLIVLQSTRSFYVEYGFTNKVIKTNYILDESHYFLSIHDSFLFGLILLAAVFNFFFFLIVRERVYLYFALWVFCLGFGRFNMGSEFFHVFLREYPRAYAYLMNFFWCTIPLVLALFIRSLLQIKKYYPSWDKIVLSFILLHFVISMTKFWADYHTVGTEKFRIGDLIQYASAIFLQLILLASFFVFLRRENGLKRWLLLTILPSFTTWVILGFTHNLFYFILKDWFHLKPSSFMTWLDRSWPLIETICLSWQVLWFSWFLLHRFVELRKQVVQKELEKEIERSQLIEQQKSVLEEQVTERTAELRQSLQELKSTQAQLIQSEKMASLGELTAGIAHEIQNPLNFMNNFSEVNKELLAEMKDEMRKGNLADAELIANDIVDNEEKINHHGKRADSIVKGMLQHSRSSSGQKELTDINKLADEYLRLSYHGMKARDKNFSSEFTTDFDENIGKINVVPQDIGRVLLNLFNNAFYAVNEKKKTAGEDYNPEVSVQTKELNDKIEIRVSDNGNGISKNIIDKIYQPFFTTKPTGQGTGLGLSLAYDIIKAHGGEIKITTKEGEGSEFTIHLPR